MSTVLATVIKRIQTEGKGIAEAWKRLGLCLRRFSKKICLRSCLLNRTLNDLRKQSKSRTALRKDHCPLPGSSKHSSPELQTKMSQGAREQRPAAASHPGRSSSRAGCPERRTVRARPCGIWRESRSVLFQVQQMFELGERLDPIYIFKGSPWWCPENDLSVGKVGARSSIGGYGKTREAWGRAVASDEK